MSAVVYITQETEDEILKGALMAYDGLSSTGCWYWTAPRELHVHKSEPNHSGKSFSQLEGKKSSERVDGIFSQIFGLSILNLPLKVWTQIVSCLFRDTMAQRASGCQRDRMTRKEWEVLSLHYFLFLRMLFGTPDSFSPTVSIIHSEHASPQKPV